MELSVSSVQSENNRRFLNFETGQDLQNYIYFRFVLHLLKKHGIKYKEATHGYKPKEVEMAKELFEGEFEYPGSLTLTKKKCFFFPISEKKKATKIELTHKCLLCAMAFRTATGLYHHRLVRGSVVWLLSLFSPIFLRNSIHLKIKFQCKICDKEYTTKTSLWEHW
jgi:hypothetical protein